MSLSLSEPVVTGELARTPNDYDLGVMLLRDHPDAAPASAWVEVYWCEQHVGRLERVDWLQLDPQEQFSVYAFCSNSGKTRVSGRDKADVLQRVEEILTAAHTPANAVAQ